MLEDIVILETKKSLPQWKKVFKLEFEYGEFDMVIHDEKDLTCEIFEIKKQYMVEKNMDFRLPERSWQLFLWDFSDFETFLPMAGMGWRAVYKLVMIS